MCSKKITPNRNYKDRLFRMLFSEKKDLLELYNALNKSSYSREEDLEITTLDDVVYLGMKNDVSILLDGRLSLYEHQSSYNPNMPFRGFLYLAELYRTLFEDKTIYGRKLIQLPSPVYVVFYNGDADIGEQRVLKLSDAFTHGNEQSEMELKALMLNINYGHNRELMEHCRTLEEYSIFVACVKKYAKEYEFVDAVEQAIEECIQKEVLTDFLRKRRSQIMNALLTEYDEEKVMAQIGQESFEDGEAKGKREGKIEGKKEGKQEEKRRYNQLILKLAEDNCTEMIVKAASDSELLEELFQKYGL